MESCGLSKIPFTYFQVISQKETSCDYSRIQWEATQQASEEIKAQGPAAFGSAK
jgi:hypothetical protein